jgi:hypothetical protein
VLVYKRRHDLLQLDSAPKSVKQDAKTKKGGKGMSLTSCVKRYKLENINSIIGETYRRIEAASGD